MQCRSGQCESGITQYNIYCVQTCLLYVFSRDQFPEEYVPTVFETYVAVIELDNQEVGQKLIMYVQTVELAIMSAAHNKGMCPEKPLRFLIVLTLVGKDEAPSHS